MEEIWRSIKDLDGEYLISNCGNAASLKYGKFKPLKLYFIGNKKNYLAFRVSFKGKYKHYIVHTAVAKAFPEICGEWFEGCEVGHINTIKTDNRPENLRVCTRKENANNPLTIAKRRGYKTDEEIAEHKKQKKRESSKRYYQRHKEYFKEYNKEYHKRPEVKEYQKEYQKNYYKKRYHADEEFREKLKNASLQYYYNHKKKAS